MTLGFTTHWQEGKEKEIVVGGVVVTRKFIVAEIMVIMLLHPIRQKVLGGGIIHTVHSITDDK